MASPDFSQLSPQAKKELARYLTLHEKTRKEHALEFWKPWSCKHNGRHTSQIEVLKSTARRRLCLGGNRVGKSEVGAADTAYGFLGIHPYRDNRVPINIKVIGEDFPNHISNVLLPKILRFLPKSSIKELKKNSQGYTTKIVGYNGSTIDFMCYEQDADKFESFECDGVWYDEPPPEDIYQGVSRGLLDREGYELFTMTPIKEPWIYNELWIPALEGKLTNTDYFILMTECNPYLKQDVIDQLKQIYSEEVQDARLRGMFSHLSGRVYKMFRKDTHVVPYFEWPKDWPVWVSIDPHPKKPHAVSWVGVTNKDQKVILDELKVACSIKELAQHILSKDSKMGYRVVDRLVDTAIKALDRTDQLRILAEHGIKCRYAKKHDDVMPGIQRVQQMLTPVKDSSDSEYIELVVRENCRGHITEFMSYVWADSDVHRPNKEFDDYMDNVRYITGVHPAFNFRRQTISYMGSGATYVGHR